MAQVTKTFTSSIRSISMSPDGKTVTATVEWKDASGVDPARQSLPVRFAGGKAYTGNASLGDVPAEIAAQAASLVSQVQSVVETLAATGKIKP